MLCPRRRKNFWTETWSGMIATMTAQSSEQSLEQESGDETEVGAAGRGKLRGRGVRRRQGRGVSGRGGTARGRGRGVRGGQGRGAPGRGVQGGARGRSRAAYRGRGAHAGAYNPANGFNDVDGGGLENFPPFTPNSPPDLRLPAGCVPTCENNFSSFFYTRSSGFTCRFYQYLCCCSHR